MQGQELALRIVRCGSASRPLSEVVRSTGDEVGTACTLLVCCKAFDADPAAFANLTLKKIPKAVLTRCEFGKDDYSLKISSLPQAPTTEPELSKQSANGHVRRSTPADGQLLLDQAEQL